MIASLSATLALWIVWRVPGLQMNARDWLMRQRGPLRPPDDIVIVAIDEPSLKRFGRFPWPRSLMARALDSLKNARPEVEMIADHIGIIDQGRMVVSGSLNDIKARYRRLRVVLEDPVELPTRWASCVEYVRQEGKVVSMLVNGNVEEIIQQVQSMPGTTVESFPVTLKDIFLEQVRGK